MTMVVAVLVLAVGYFAGGAVGDFFFQRTRRGRALVAATAVLLGAVLLYFTMSVPMENQSLFLVMLSLTALFIPFSSPNVISTVYDVTLPEVRSTAVAVQYFIESAGAATAPFLAGLIAVRSSLHDAILIVCESTWVLCAIFLVVVAYLVPHDIETLRQAMRQRAAEGRVTR
jgi:MFS family permease